MRFNRYGEYNPVMEGDCVSAASAKKSALAGYRRKLACAICLSLVGISQAPTWLIVFPTIWIIFPSENSSCNENNRFKFIDQDTIFNAFCN